MSNPVRHGAGAMKLSSKIVSLDAELAKLEL